MKRKNDAVYYNLRETSIIINKSVQTLRDWLQINDAMMDKGETGIIPQPTQIGNTMFYTEKDIEVIKSNMRSFKKGDFKIFREAKTTYQKIKEENVRLKKELNILKGSK